MTFPGGKKNRFRLPAGRRQLLLCDVFVGKHTRSGGSMFLMSRRDLQVPGISGRKTTLTFGLFPSIRRLR